MVSCPPATTSPRGYSGVGGTKATLFTKPWLFDKNVGLSYLMGFEDSTVHRRTDLSREADSTKDGSGNATALT